MATPSMPTEVEARSQPDPRWRPPHTPSHIPVDLWQEEAIDGAPNGSRLGTSYFAPSQPAGAYLGRFELATDGLVLPPHGHPVGCQQGAPPRQPALRQQEELITAAFVCAQATRSAAASSRGYPLLDEDEADLAGKGGHSFASVPLQQGTDIDEDENDDDEEMIFCNKILKDFWSPLIIAVQRRSVKCVNLLLEAGAEVKCMHGTTHLSVAVAYGLTDGLKPLLDAGADRKVEMNLHTSDHGICIFYMFKALKVGNELMNAGRLKQAFPYYEKVMQAADFKVRQNRRFVGGAQSTENTISTADYAILDPRFDLATGCQGAMADGGVDGSTLQLPQVRAPSRPSRPPPRWRSCQGGTTRRTPLLWHAGQGEEATGATSLRHCRRRESSSVVVPSRTGGEVSCLRCDQFIFFAWVP